MLPKDNRTLCILAGTAVASAAAIYVLLGPSGSKKRKRSKSKHDLVKFTKPGLGADVILHIWTLVQK